MTLRTIRKWLGLIKPEPPVVLPAAPWRKHMSPISNDRARHIIERLEVLGAMRKNITRRVAFYRQTLNLDQATLMAGLQGIQAEELTLVVELDVLKTDFGVAP
jgi:hypothetical protein